MYATINSPYNTYTHTGPAADADQQSRHRGDERGRRAGRRATGCTTSTPTPRDTCSSPTTRRRSPRRPPSARRTTGAAADCSAGPPCSGGRSRTRCHPSCTARRTPRSDWTGRYEAIECGEDELPDVLAARADWAGFSCTMPLKRRALALASSASPVAQRRRRRKHPAARPDAAAGAPTTPTSPESSARSPSTASPQRP